MKKTSIYKLDSKGKQRVVTIWVEGNPTSETEPATLYMESGLVEGKKVKQSLEISEGKNKGKSNATTPYTQAVSEAKAKVELKLREGYVSDLSQATQGILRSGISAPMLAQKYHPTGEQKGSKTLEKMKLVGKKIHVQPKLDGNRCLIKVTPSATEAVMYTRKGDVMPVQLQDILSEVLNAYNANHSEFAGVELILDGELFSDEMSFNELNGHLKRKDSQDAEQLAKIKYHIYDIQSNEPYNNRYELVKLFASKHIEVIPSYEIEATDAAIQEKLEQFLEEGHEGLMIRTLDRGYENKRSWQLCKVKIFEDEEFEVVDIFLDKRSNSIDEGAESILGGFIMKLPAPTKDRDGKELTTFKAGITGLNREEQGAIVVDKNNYIGKMATVEFFGRSEYGIPRFPKLKSLRDD